MFTIPKTILGVANYVITPSPPRSIVGPLSTGRKSITNTINTVKNVKNVFFLALSKPGANRSLLWASTSNRSFSLSALEVTEHHTPWSSLTVKFILHSGR